MVQLTLIYTVGMFLLAGCIAYTGLHPLTLWVNKPGHAVIPWITQQAIPRIAHHTHTLHAHLATHTQTHTLNYVYKGYKN